MKRIYEAWLDDKDGASVTFSPPEVIAELRDRGLLHLDAKLLHKIEADTMEEALAVHYIRMGWAPYQPHTKPAKCPNGCGAFFYPGGSGECPNCGKIC